MGSYAAYTGAMNIPPEWFPTFNRYMEKILNYGGIIWCYNRKVMGHDIILICPVNFMEPTKKIQNTGKYEEGKRLLKEYFGR